MSNIYLRRSRLLRIDAFLRRFNEEMPVLFWLFATGIALMLAGITLKVSDLIGRLL